MSKLTELESRLVRGRVYRRAELILWSKSVDKHLKNLVAGGTIWKLSHGLYYYPEMSAFGEVPPSDAELISSLLKDERFLIISPNAYNALGIGTTQLYNTRVVYNHKRQGEFKFRNQAFRFQIKPDFPAHPTVEFLLVNLVNNIDSLAEDKETILANAIAKARTLNSEEMLRSVKSYGNRKTQKLLLPILNF